MEFTLSTEDRNDLLALARRTIEGYVHRTPGRQTNLDDFSDNLHLFTYIHP
jgi:hypothetical protein